MSVNTERENRTSPEARSKRQSDQATMLEQALRQPGIGEMMRVYEDWKVTDSGLDAYRAATKAPMSTTTTNHANA